MVAGDSLHSGAVAIRCAHSLFDFLLSPPQPRTFVSTASFPTSHAVLCYGAPLYVFCSLRSGATGPLACIEYHVDEFVDYSVRIHSKVFVMHADVIIIHCVVTSMPGAGTDEHVDIHKQLYIHNMQT